MTRSLAYALVLSGTLIINPCASSAQDEVADILLQSVRQGARLADDIPLRHLDEAMTTVRRGLDDLPAGGIRAADDALLLSLQASNPTLARRIASASPETRSLALRFHEGARSIERVVADVTRRVDIIDQFGGPGLVYAARGAPEAQDLLRLDGAIRAGHVSNAQAADFITNLPSFSAKVGRFWREAIVPNWRPLALGGGLAAFIAAPDSFIDAAGFVTERAASAFSQAGVEIPLAFTRGVGEGIIDAVQEQTKDGRWIGLALGGVAIIVALAMILRLISPSRLFGVFRSAWQFVKR